MERSSLASEKLDEADFNLREWALKARRISRENTNSRRFSASNLKSFREDQARSFRSNVTVSSTASSPGYTLKEEIDPSTYSFTTALREKCTALQAKTVYTWEVQPREGLTLNSKWNEAEKYISNPLSGEVPLECLSAKTLSGRSFRGLNTRITMSAPLIYTPQMHHFPANPLIHEHEPQLDLDEKKTRDVGTQSTPVNLSSSSPSPAPTPSIEERSRKVSGDSSISLKSDTELQVEMEESREGERKEMVGGCLSLRSLWMRTQKHKLHKHKPRTRTNILFTFLHHLNGCSKQ